VAVVTACVTVGTLGGSGLPAAAQGTDVPSQTSTGSPAVPAIGAPGSTNRITLVASRVQDGWRYDQYRNPAYPCAVSGDNTFIIATALGTPTNALRPLWVYMHGGGFGYFDDTGTPQPNTWHMTEETLTRQIAFLRGGDSSRGGGILVAARTAPAGFRMLGVSMCGHDGYGGADVPDPDNPNRTADGRPRTVNGLYATKAAIAFAQRKVPTDDVVLHGSSAGSFGAWHVAWGLAEQGLPPTAVIADSGVFSTARAGWLDEDPGCGTNAGGAQRFRARLHPAILDPDNEPGDLVADGRISSPVLDLWVGNDPIWCGDTPVRCPVDDGPDVNLGATDCMHEGVRRAIAAQGPNRRSRSMELCVDEPALTQPEDCDRHVPSVVSDFVNTAAPWPEDYRASIMDWVDDRLADDAPQPSDWPAGMAFATAAVVDLLGRADPARATAIVTAMIAGRSKRSELDRLTRSPEWLEAIVQQLYRTTLGRVGDPASVAYWTGELASDRRTVANVTAAFYASPDYFGRVGGTPSSWIAALYTAVLGRPASRSDITYWVDQVRRRGRSVVALAMVQSPESAGDRVTGLYERLLGRHPSKADIAYWGPRVRAEGDLALASQLAVSSEYQTRAERRFP
jgi:hypothetical protein